jgi:hypothetical protein
MWLNVPELYSLTYWIQKEIGRTDVVALYIALADAVQQNAGGSSSPFESQKDNLLITLRQVPVESLTKEQFEFLEKLGIAPAVGQSGIEDRGRVKLGWKSKHVKQDGRSHLPTLHRNLPINS